MLPSTIRIATRTSLLAMWQAREVERLVQILYPDLKIVLNGISTQGDKILDTPLAHIGGKGLFVKELEQSILAGQADIAVHSMKDVPVELPPGLHLPVILARADPRDAMVSNHYQNLDAMPQHSIVGTSSLRRECQLRTYRPDLEILSLRGNVHTRLKRLDEGKYAAIILASAGLHRLGLDARIGYPLSVQQSLPAIGQGAIGIECRIDDIYINNIIAPLVDPDTSACVNAERAMNRRLQGGCQVPIAGYAVRENNALYLRGLVGTPDGKRVIRAEGRASITETEALGIQVAEQLLDQGAADILGSFK